MKVALVDYGSGNLHSAAKAFERAAREAELDASVSVTADPAIVAAADRIVLPGVGAFGACAASLRGSAGLVEAMETAVFSRGRPFLGICVGMQLMAEYGEEHGTHSGMGWIAGRVRRMIPADPSAKVPHMGWNEVTLATPHPLIEPGEAYFLHSYAFEGEDVIATTDHAGPVTAAVAHDTAIGVQFHPEKSQRYGLALLERFVEWRP